MPAEVITPRPTAEDLRLETDALARRAVIENLRPQIDGGRFPIKRTPGETVTVRADVFADGHDVLAVVLLDRPVAENADRVEKTGGQTPAWRETEMTLVAPGTDEWTASFIVDRMGWHEYAVEAWVDSFRSWLHGFEIKAHAGQDVRVELLEGSLLIREAAGRADARGAAGDAARLLARADALTDETTVLADRVALAADPELGALMFVHADRSRSRRSEALRVWVDRERARFSAWYEFFPRSAGPDPHRSATFDEAAGLLPRIASLGFDVVYLPPIHPIGLSFRKGPNNSLISGDYDPGSPWAIGSSDGGHTAVEPGLGTVDDFVRFRETAERLGLEVALDIAWQCSPDHPWITEHPEWFKHRPDGTIKYAENPPKKYQDIYPFDFACEEWRSLWHALLEVMFFWIERGVRIFRVDNPHTKTLAFWEWMIAEIHARYPDVLFLSEAFTRPKLMRYLAKAGFTQSYTYFTWRTTKDELSEYLTELVGTDMREYFRPNFFTNTPDILHAYLQHGGRPAFEARLILAATLAASYGIYSGFELCDGRAAGPASEEYANSEKYQYRHWDWARPGNINELVARVNGIRRQHAALQYNDTLRFHATDNPALIAYSKTAPDGAERLLTIVNLDPHHMQHGWVDAGPLDSLRPLTADPTDENAFYTVRDLLDDSTYGWRGRWNYVRLDPGVRQGHVMLIQN